MTDYPRWESVVVTDPRGAYGQGAPNQLVLERRKKGEDQLDAAVRVKREEFRRLNPQWYAEHIEGNVPTTNVPTGANVGTKVSLQEDVPTPIVPTEEVVPRDGLSEHDITTGLCAACGVKPREGRYMKCAACRKRGQRG